jgi:hypothetical protein
VTVRHAAVALLAMLPLSGCFTYCSKEIVLDHTVWRSKRVDGIDAVATAPNCVRARVRYEDGTFDRSSLGDTTAATASFQAAKGPIVFVDGGPRTAELRIGRPVQLVDSLGKIAPETVALTAEDASRATIVLAEREKFANDLTLRASFPPAEGRPLDPNGCVAALGSDTQTALWLGRGDIVEDGSHAAHVAGFVALLPLTVAADVATSPIQLLVLGAAGVVFLCMHWG